MGGQCTRPRPSSKPKEESWGVGAGTDTEVNGLFNEFLSRFTVRTDTSDTVYPGNDRRVPLVSNL